MILATLVSRNLGQATSLCFSKISFNILPKVNTSSVFIRILPSSSFSTLSSTKISFSIDQNRIAHVQRHDRQFHRTNYCQDLMEFFDAKENWNKQSVKCGRPWRLEELRIKSNQDLHKLWYILLKERNALMTMEEEYKRRCELMPSPERLYKVDESMQNILFIVRERDDALSQLETGKSILPQVWTVRNFMGLKYQRTVKEYAVPKWMNNRYSLMHARYPKGLGQYFKLYHEKLRLKKERAERARKKRLKRLKELFPHAEIEEE